MTWTRHENGSSATPTFGRRRGGVPRPLCLSKVTFPPRSPCRVCRLMKYVCHHGVIVSDLDRVWMFWAHFEIETLPLLWAMYWYMHWCVEFENENTFQMYKRLFYCTHAHTHTHTHTTNVTIVRSVRRCAGTSADDRCRRCTSAVHVSLHRQQILEWVAFWTL